MNIQQFTQTLEENSDSWIRFVLPSGNHVPDHFHVTEVGRIDKNFIDCGGTRRKIAACSLQVWTANDFLHRLTAGKLAGIIKLAEPILAADDLPVEVEYGEYIAGQYSVDEITKQGNQLVITLAGKQTDCLAKDKCGVQNCCDSTSGCCS